MNGYRTLAIAAAALVWAMPLCAKLSAQSSSSQAALRPPSQHTASLDSPSVDTAIDEASSGDAAQGTSAAADLLDMDIEQLRRVSVAPALEMEVSTVSRQPSTVGRSPAAVYVVTPEMIRRSGAQTIPEVLRMVPGLQVAHRDSNKWAVSSRGFNNTFANKLLVQIDGRTVYTPVFAGTHWDVQDVVLEDIQRIEVIRGPGATLWGANAVNGVINIITKSSRDTTGIYAKVGGGTEEKGFGTARVGGCQDDLAWRGYFKWFERDRGIIPGRATHDGWRQNRLDT